ncbi:hypothetical protein NKH34_09300 [Mesorhizobium sp. M1148]|uniref:PIN-like domain-containing protein n=1 Tax=unclassified Mesorhizobium TaxID=325217 RepID=UPI003339934D
MKVAFDENMPAAMVRVFTLFHKERSLKHLVQGVEIKSAKDYTPKPDDPDYQRKSDVPWIRRYAAKGGRIIVSGDVKMPTVPHERLALVEAGMVVVFFAPKWDNWQFCRKAALLLHWWPTILGHVRTASPGFFVVPCTWPDDSEAQLREISTEDAKLVKMQRQIAETAPRREVRRLKRQAAAADQIGMFDEGQGRNG